MAILRGCRGISWKRIEKVVQKNWMESSEVGFCPEEGDFQERLL
jgi:hypothetical protein